MKMFVDFNGNDLEFKCEYFEIEIEILGVIWKFFGI